MDTAPPIPSVLRPMSLSELLDRVFTLYRNNFWLFCGIMALPEAVRAVFGVLYAMSSAVRSAQVLQPNPQYPFAVFAVLGRGIAAAGLLAVVEVVLGAIALGAVTVAVSQLYLSQPVSVIGSYRSIRGKIGGLIGLIFLLLLIAFALLAALGIGGGILGAVAMLGAGGFRANPIAAIAIIYLAILIAIVFGLYVMMRFAVSVPVYVLERIGVAEAMGRSGALTKGRRWRIFGAVIVVVLIAYAVQMIFVVPFMLFTIPAAFQRSLIPAWAQIGTAIAGAVGGTIAGPLLTITVALIYYDVRIRKEAFDLESMMKAAGPVPTPPVPPAAPAAPWQPGS
jgi:Membrane domain of glycerophosphoryl diester phosphodiesterase